MVEFEEICLETLIAAIQKHQQYLNSNKTNLENQQKYLSQSAIIRQVWSQIEDQEGYRSKYLFGEVFRALEDREWLKSKTGKRRAKLYFPTSSGMEVYRNFTSTDPEYAAGIIKRKPEVQIPSQVKSIAPKTSEILQTLSNYFQHSLQAEQTISRISARFISFSSLDEAIYNSLVDIGSLFQADRVFIIDFLDVRTNQSKQYEWRAPGVQEVIGMFQDISTDQLPLSFRQSKPGGDVWHRHMDDLPEESVVEKEFLQRLESRSILILPLFWEERFSGVLGIIDTLGNRVISEEDIRLFRICAEIVSTALAREKMSFALNQRVKALNCLHEIDKIAQKPDLPLKKALKKIVSAIPSVWQYPDMAGACIIYEGEKIATKHFQIDGWTQAADIMAKKAKLGSITVSYPENLPSGADWEEPFLSEEQKTLKTIAERVASIIEHRNADEALRRSEEKYRFLVEQMQDGVVMGENRILTFVNSRFAEMLGYTPEEMIGQHADSFVHPDALPQMNEERNNRRKGLSSTYNSLLVKKDGTPVPVIISAAPFYTSEGTYRGALAVFTNISKLKQVEEALRKSEDEYQSLIENIPAVAWKTTSEGRTTFISSNVEKIFGFTPEEIYKMGEDAWFGRIHADDVNYVKERYKALFTRNEEFNVEYRIQRKDGQWIWLRDKAITVYEENGFANAYGVFSDITSEKQLE